MRHIGGHLFKWRSSCFYLEKAFFIQPIHAIATFWQIYIKVKTLTLNYDSPELSILKQFGIKLFL